MTTTTTVARPTRTRNKAAAIQPEIQVAASGFTVRVAQEALKRALIIVGHAVAAKSTLPVLSNVLLATDGTCRLKISATNLEIGVVVTIGAEVEREGALTMPAKLLADVVGSLPNAPIALEMDSRTQCITLGCEQFAATINGIEADEFPLIPTLRDQAPIATFEASTLCEATQQVSFAAATNDTRPVLTGVRIQLGGQSATLAATDTFRLAFSRIALEEPAARALELVVPARAMHTLAKVLAHVEGDVELLVSPDSNQVVFRTEGLEVVSRSIDGTYPNIDRYLSLPSATVVTMETRELAKAVRLASYFAAASANVIRLQAEPSADSSGSLILSANAAEVGDNTSSHRVTVEGPGGTVALNAAFLAAGLDAIATPSVALHLGGERQPVVVQGVGTKGYTYVAMPMTVHE